MVSFTRSRAVLELGRKLVDQLDADDDLLASWMAHYVAQLIQNAESATAEEKPGAEERCAKAILELWQYRASFPNHLRPFASLEPVVRTLASLDDEAEYRYYPESFQEAAAANGGEDGTKWLKFAIGIDAVARSLIQETLLSAAPRAVASAEPWVGAAGRAGVEVGVEGAVVGFVKRGQHAPRAVLQKRLKKLEAFVELATSLADKLRGQIDQSEQEPGQEEDTDVTDD